MQPLFTVFLLMKLLDSLCTHSEIHFCKFIHNYSNERKFLVKLKIFRTSNENKPNLFI